MVRVTLTLIVATILVLGHDAEAAYGDGVLDPFEQCDDSNRTDGDGCSSIGQVEGDDFPVVLYAADVVPPTPALTDLPLLAQVTRHGVTWTFSQPARVGRFVNGDYYVVGSVTVTAIDPPPTGGRHGSMLNILPNLQKSGWDDRIGYGRYDASLRVSPPLTLTPGNKLLSSISATSNLAAVMRPIDTSESPVKSISILTSVASPQPLDAFRPSYGDTGNTTWLAHTLRRDLLPTLAPPASVPPLAEFEGYLKWPWVDTVFFNFDVPAEYMPSYGKENAYLMSFAGLLLTLNFTPAHKEPLLVYLVQYGIDLYGMVKAGHDGWEAWGGHGSGRKLPIVLAGVMLDDVAVAGAQARFQEDLQTAWVSETPPAGTYTQTWHHTPQTVVYAGHRGFDGVNDDPSWGPYEHLPPPQWLLYTGYSTPIGESYRRCCTSVGWVGEALAAWLVPGMKTAWNHEPFFAYVDRWMTPDDPLDLAAIDSAWSWPIDVDFQQGQSWRILSGGGYHSAWRTFVDDMWAAYRNVAPTQTCVALGGSCCTSGQLCPGGSFQVSTDCSGRCCLGGGTCQSPPATCAGEGYYCCDSCGASQAWPELKTTCAASQVCCTTCAEGGTDGGQAGDDAAVEPDGAAGGDASGGPDAGDQALSGECGCHAATLPAAPLGAVLLVIVLGARGCRRQPRI